MNFSILLIDDSNLQRLMAVPIYGFFFFLLNDLLRFIYRPDTPLGKSTIALQHKSYCTFCSFGIEMNNFSLGLSQDEKFVKASEVDVLFDKNAIFKLLVIICFLMHISFSVRIITSLLHLHSFFFPFIILLLLVKKQSIYFRMYFSFKRLSETILMVPS